MLENKNEGRINGNGNGIQYRNAQYRNVKYTPLFASLQKDVRFCASSLPWETSLLPICLREFADRGINKLEREVISILVNKQ